MKDTSGEASVVATAGGLALGAAAVATYWNYVKNVAKPPRLWLGDGPLRQRVLPNCKALLRPYAPTPWAANQHVQTVLGFLRSLTIHSTYSRQLILTTDGATLGLDWFEGCDNDGPDARHRPSDPVLLVCHGINGGSHEGYAKWVCSAAAERGWRAVVLNYRGCNGLPFTAPRGYAATMSHDVYTAVYAIRARFPTAPIMAVGYSLGGLKLTKYLAEADAGLHLPPPGHPRLFTGSGLAAAAVVSSPVSLGRSAEKLADRRSLNYMYNLAVAYKIREHLALHRADIAASGSFDVDSALAAWTMTEIEEQGLPASFGFADRQQYYEAASSPDYIPAITTPTLILLAEDDPFLGVIPDAECSRNPNTLLALTRHGGHVAFLQGHWPLGRSYMDDAVLEFFAATLQHLHTADPRVGGTSPPAPPAGAAAARAAAGADAALSALQAHGEGQAAATNASVAAGLGVGRARAAQVPDAVRAGVAAAAVAAATRPWAIARCSGAMGEGVGCCKSSAAPAPPAAAAAAVVQSDAPQQVARRRTGGGGRAQAQARAACPGPSAVAPAYDRDASAAAQIRLLAHLQRQAERARMLQSVSGQVEGAPEKGTPAAPRSRL